MCEYTEIEKIKLSNGKTIKEVNEEVRKEVERIYLRDGRKESPYLFGIKKAIII